jgi:ComF family protein
MNRAPPAPAAPVDAREIWRGLLDLLLPVHCVACEGRVGSPGDVVCGPCWSRLVPLPHPQCERCGHPTRGRPCRWCVDLPPYVRSVRSGCWFAGGAAEGIVRALKYDGWIAVAAGMAERMARLSWPPDVVEERAALVPVPLAAPRRRERGYNQSALLAGHLARRWRVPVWEDVLVRARNTRTQTRLTPAERLRNVAGAFLASAGARDRLRGAHVVLADDVVTTGATVRACAAALVAGGARIVSCVTFARAPSSGDRC